MKLRSLLLCCVMTFSLDVFSSDNSSRTLYILADSPVSQLDLGLYRLDLALEQVLRPELANFLNIIPEMVHNRTFITVGQTTSMVLVLETKIDAAPDRERSKLQSENICDLVQGAQVRFMRANRLANFFISKNPFSDKRPEDFSQNLESVLRLKVRVQMGGLLPEVVCNRSLTEVSEETKLLQR